MMFLMHVAFMLGLIALTGALALLIWGLRTKGPGKELAKFFGVIMIVVVIVDFICVGYYAINYWRENYFETPTAMMTGKSMGNENMMNGPMRGNMMNKNTQ